MYRGLTSATCSSVRTGFRAENAYTKYRNFSQTATLRKAQDLDRMPTDQVASELAKAETQKTGTGPIAGGPAATAQSIKDKQNNLADKVHDIASKQPEEITEADAATLQSREDRILGQEARGSGTLASEVQSQAAKNQK